MRLLEHSNSSKSHITTHCHFLFIWKRVQYECSPLANITNCKKNNDDDDNNNGSIIVAAPSLRKTPKLINSKNKPILPIDSIMSHHIQCYFILCVDFVRNFVENFIARSKQKPFFRKRCVHWTISNGIMIICHSCIDIYMCNIITRLRHKTECDANVWTLWDKRSNSIMVCSISS